MTKTHVGLRMLAGTLLCLGISTAATAQNAQDRAASATKRVDGNFIRANAAQKQTPDWPSVGLDYSESRFSKLDQVNAGNVKDLGLVWSYNLESTRGVEATPLVVDGVMYVTASWSVVHADRRAHRQEAVDFRSAGRQVARATRAAATWSTAAWPSTRARCTWRPSTAGSSRWTPPPARRSGRRTRSNGQKRQLHHHRRAARVQGQGDHRQRRRRVRRARLRHRLRRRDGRTAVALVHGAGRSDASPSRTHRWPRPPRPGTRRASTGRSAAAARRGTAIAYDPELNLMYVGTGNGSPWCAQARSPKGGDNLYLASIVALDPDTGKYVWHYQETPGDNWDYTSTQPMILADLKIGGKRAQGAAAGAEERLLLRHRPHQRQVHLGEELRRSELGHRLRQERPARSEMRRAARDGPSRSDAIPGPFGAHNWHPMSFNPQTGPGLPAGAARADQPDGRQGLDVQRRRARPPARAAWAGTWPSSRTSSRPRASPSAASSRGTRSRRRKPGASEHVSPWNGGTLTTAGNLVFQGTADGRLLAYNARTGDKLWETPDRHRRGGGALAPTWSTASSTCRSRSAGAACTAWRSAPPSGRGRARSTPSRWAARRNDAGLRAVPHGQAGRRA